MGENDSEDPQYGVPDSETGIIELPSGAKLVPVSVGDLLRQAKATCQTMSAHNPNRRLINDLGCALQQLMERLEQYENPQGGIS